VSVKEESLGGGEPLDTKILQLAGTIKEQGLASLVIPLLDVLQVWGFVGSQLLWMAAPLIGGTSTTMLAEIMEEPGALQRLQHYLLEGEPQP
jgi:hypothetical protein